MAKDENPEKLRDPLGVIENCAKQIWRDKGQPAGTTWESFLQEAEQLVLSGRSEPHGSEKRPALSPRLETTPRGIWEMRDQDHDAFGAALAGSIDSLLNEHECYCLTQLLHSTEFKLKGAAFHKCSDEEIIHYLTHVAGEYDSDFLKREANGDLEQLPAEKRARYWRERVERWTAEDTPLSFHDRNTMDRMKDALCRQSVVESTRLSTQ